MIQVYFTSNVQYFLFYFKGQGFLISAASANNESEKTRKHVGRYPHAVSDKKHEKYIISIIPVSVVIAEV